MAKNNMPNNFCQHGKWKSHCKDCKGSCFCEHGRQKSQCKDCGGSGICQHGKLKSRCKDCGGSSICQHGRLKKPLQGLYRKIRNSTCTAKTSLEFFCKFIKIYYIIYGYFKRENKKSENTFKKK
jgi:hypothetical protein